jgi:hypothetical protein
MKSFKSYITEQAELVESLRSDFKDIPQNEYDQVIAADPTTDKNVKPMQPGSYSRWLLNIYKKHSKEGRELILKFHDEFYPQVLRLYDKAKQLKLVDKTNIDSFKSVGDLRDYLDSKQVSDEVLSKKDLKKALKANYFDKNVIKSHEGELVYEDDKWAIVVPQSHRAACFYGLGTGTGKNNSWCISTPSSDAHYKSITGQGTMYIILSKTERLKTRVGAGQPVKYGFNWEASEFRDAENKQVTSYTDSENFVQKTFGTGVLNFFKRNGGPLGTNTLAMLIAQKYPNVSEEQWKTTSKSIDCRANRLTSLEGAPKEVGGNFDCAKNRLTSLEGAPKEVGGGFYCTNNQLASLEGAPEKVGGTFDCVNNQLTSLEGAPEEVGGKFFCSDNQLTSLEGAPKEVGRSFNCNRNELTSLEGAPEKVGLHFDCSQNKLTSLKGAPKEVVGDFECHNNRLTSLEGAPKEVGGNFDCYYNSGKFTEEYVRKVCKVKGNVNVG